MLKAIKIRLYPNKNQQEYINKLLGCCRVVYNKCLDKKKISYLDDKSNLNLTHLSRYFHKELIKLEEYSFLKEHNTKILKQSILNMLDSYKRFFINNNGFPKFKSKHDNKQSCRFPIDAISTTNNYMTNKLTLTKQLKNLKFKCSSKDQNYLQKYRLNIKSATLTKNKSENYFLSILIDGDIERKLPKPKNDIIGIDMGIKKFLVCSNGETFDNIKIKRNNEKKLIKLNRQLSKKINGSKNKNKQRIKLAKYQEKLNNIKENYLHKVSNKLLNENQVIVIENLSIKNMMLNHKLARSIQELSLNQFKNIMLYKSNWYGRYIVEVDKWFPSSKLCSVCGFKNDELTLSDREWICPKCYTNHDRDKNASTNIENEGKRIVGVRYPKLTLVDNHNIDWMKQEIK